MENYLFELVHLVLRYFHVIAGIAWIGASFYFAWPILNFKNEVAA